jgi:MFS family permease
MLKRGTTALLLALSSLTTLAGATISPALPALLAHFAATPNADILVRLILTVPGLAIALTAIFAGRLSDRIGRLPLIKAGLLLYVVAGASGLVLDQLWTILLGRIALGVAVGLLMPSTGALLADYFLGSERERVMGWQSSATGFGGGFFLITGGLLANWHWRGPFAVYLGVLLLYPLVHLIFVEPKRLSLAQQESNARDPFPWRACLPLAAYAFFGMMVFYAMPVHFPFLLKERGIATPLLAGLGVATAVLSSACVSLKFGAIRQRYSRYRILISSYTLIATGYVVIGAFPFVATAYLGAMITGMGMGIQMPNLYSWIQSKVPANKRGQAAGLFSSSMFLGQFLSPFVITPIARFANASVVYLVLAGIAYCMAGIGILWARSSRPTAA